MKRKELYAQITSLGLQDEVKATYGDNYTRCSNAQLQAVVDNALNSLKELENSVGLRRLVEVLQKKKILLKSEVTYILGA